MAQSKRPIKSLTPRALEHFRSSIPLFDRLSSLETSPFEMHGGIPSWDLHHLEKSIIKEVHLLLNTRVTDKAPPDDPDDNFPQGPSCLGYGVKDFSWSHTGDPFSMERIARYLETVIKTYEPRLKSPQVSSMTVDTRIMGIRCQVSGHIVAGTLQKALNFPVQSSHLFKERS